MNLSSLAELRTQLLADVTQVEACLAAARASLPLDPLSQTRLQAIKLIEQLLEHPPGAAEATAFGRLLISWGEIYEQEAPQKALDLYEAAWSYAESPELRSRLARLYGRQGLVDGAWALAPGPHPEGYWPRLSCNALGCKPCQAQLHHSMPSSHGPGGELLALTSGHAWVQRHTNPWRHSHGVGIANHQGELQASHCRAYPQGWGPCGHASEISALSCAHLQYHQQGLPQPTHFSGAVLAVADLSAELYFHGLLELLPRVGRHWQQLQKTEAPLRLWHNGGSSVWIEEALQRLGIPANCVLHASNYPHIKADNLLVPPFAGWFGSPSPSSLAWLQEFWAPPKPLPSRGPIYLGRGAVGRRPVLGEQALIEQLAAHGMQPLAAGFAVGEEMAQLAAAPLVVAAHGGAMANLLLASAGTQVLELSNPAYRPPYFACLQHHNQLRWANSPGKPTPLALQALLYEGPLSYPITPEPELLRQKIDGITA